jgi:hypothetical protein
MDELRAACSQFLPKWRGALYQQCKRMERLGLLVVSEDGNITRRLE